MVFHSFWVLPQMRWSQEFWTKARQLAQCRRGNWPWNSLTPGVLGDLSHFCSTINCWWLGGISWQIDGLVSTGWSSRKNRWNLGRFFRDSLEEPPFFCWHNRPLCPNFFPQNQSIDYNQPVSNGLIFRNFRIKSMDYVKSYNVHCRTLKSYISRQSIA